MEIIDIINKYLNNETIDNESYDSKLLKLSIEQSLQTILYSVTNIIEYKKYYVSWVILQEKFFKLQDEITDLFNKNNIKHIYFKGSVLSRLYDDPSVRTRGDIDFYVSLEDFDKANKLLIDNGFVVDKETEDCAHHVGYKKYNIECEMHFNMFDMDNDKAWRKMFNNPFELSELVENSLYKYNDTYHFIYCILHFAHHLRHGAGIRYMLDFYYMMKKTNIDYNLVHNLVKELHIEVLYENIINTVYKLSNIKFDENVNDKDIQFFINYMLSYGIHGHSNNESVVNSTAHPNKIKYIFGRSFLTDKSYRKTRYPKLGSHWYLYPLCLIKHWIYLITHKMGAFFKFLFGKNKNKSLYKDLGV